MSNQFSVDCSTPNVFSGSTPTVNECGVTRNISFSNNGILTKATTYFLKY